MANSTKELLFSDPVKFASYCNGCGSKVGFWTTILWYILPDTIWFIDFTDCFDIHDVEYSWPIKFTDRIEALAFKTNTDIRFYQNMLIRIKQYGGIFEELRKIRAWGYFKAVSELGQESFLKEKIFINA
jgi:hypothetical protein